MLILIDTFFKTSIRALQITRCAPNACEDALDWPMTCTDMHSDRSRSSMCGCMPDHKKSLVPPAPLFFGFSKASVHVVLTIVMIRFAFESKWIGNRSSGWRVRVCLQGRLGRAFSLSQNRRDACLSLVSVDTTHAVRNELNLPGSWLRKPFVVIREVSPPQLVAAVLLSGSHPIFISNRLVCSRLRELGASCCEFALLPCRLSASCPDTGVATGDGIAAGGPSSTALGVTPRSYVAASCRPPGGPV